jgi:hypothetical protein
LQGLLKKTELLSEYLKKAPKNLPHSKTKIDITNENRNLDIKKSSDLSLIRIPPRLLGFAMGILLKVFPPLRMILSGHTNVEETKSYCRDVLLSAQEMKISLPRFKGSKKFFIDRAVR